MDKINPLERIMAKLSINQSDDLCATVYELTTDAYKRQGAHTPLPFTHAMRETLCGIAAAAAASSTAAAREEAAQLRMEIDQMHELIAEVVRLSRDILEAKAS